MILFDLAKVFSFGGRCSVAELPSQTRRAMYAPELTSFGFCGTPKNVASCFFVTDRLLFLLLQSLVVDLVLAFL
jgi:hypothetical protein